MADGLRRKILKVLNGFSPRRKELTVLIILQGKRKNHRKEGEGMNDYKVTFKRSNGTIGTAIFTVATRGEAGDAFRTCYRHDIYTILSIEHIERPQLAHRG